MLGPGFLSFASFGFAFALFKGWIPYSKNVDVLSTVLVSVIVLIVFGYSTAESPLWLWYEATRKRKAFLPVYVSRLGRADVFSVVLLMLFKRAMSALRLLSGPRPDPDGHGFLLAEVKLDASLKIDDGDEVRYDDATRTLKLPAHKKSSSSTATASSRSGSSERVMLLPALTAPMVAALLANRNCPVQALGAVNTKNRFEFIDPAACRDPVGLLDLSKTIVTGRLGGSRLKGRRVKRGMEVDVEIEVHAPRKGQRQGRVVFRQLFTVLAFLPASAKPIFVQGSDAKTDEKNAITDRKWAASAAEPVELAEVAPRRWAALSKDYNPIHMSTRMARLFGFPGRIAHGNHVLTCALEGLLKKASARGGKKASAGPEGRLWDLLYSDVPAALDVQFRRPIVLPAKLAVELASGGSDFELRTVGADGKENLTAQISELRP